nr:hypothetical protein [Micromonospora sp. Llam0]
MTRPTPSSRSPTHGHAPRQGDRGAADVRQGD